MKRMTVIFDLDGTLALIDKRKEKSTKPNGKFNWKEFFNPENIKLDEPNVPVIESFKSMKKAGFEVGIFSGRDEVTRLETERWLEKWGVQWDFLVMRPERSFTPDDVLKKSWLDTLVEQGKQILCVFDDRDKVVKMWRENGVTCFQVAPGNF